MENENIIECDKLFLKQVNKSDNDLEVEYEVIKLNEETDRVKPGPKPKQLKAMEVYGYEVGRGNNKKIVVPDDIYKLANIGCNDREIAAWFNIDENTLRYNFSEVMEKGRIELKTRLRRTLISTALGGNAVLLIFLAKNMLGMSDNPNDSSANSPLPWNEKDEE